MELELTGEETRFREEVRTFLRHNVTEDMRRRVGFGYPQRKQDTLQWHQALHAQGWAGIGWPKEYGGTGWSPVQRMIFLEECAYAQAPELQGFNIYMLGPVLMAYGTQEQKAYHLPRILALEDWWCQGFSEPNAGSDLAAIKMAAVREGDEYVVNGSKTWTSLAQHADMMFCIVRTSRDSGRKQDGISFLMLDMRSPGITIRPIPTIDGTHHVNEVFFDNVRVPVSLLVGEEGRGWTYAKYLLSNERAAIAKVGKLRDRLEFAKQLARTLTSGGEPLIASQSLRERIAQLEVETKALEITQLRVVTAQTGGEAGKFDPKSSILKLRGSELLQAVLELIVDIGGPASLRRTDSYPDVIEAGFSSTSARYLSEPYLFARSATIYGGSTEVQKNILAKMVLGLQ